MNCRNCNAEWTTPNGVNVDNCPFCGKVLVDSTSSSKQAEPHEILLKIVEQFGKKKLGDPSLKGILLDYMPHVEEKYVRVFKQAVNDKIGIELLKVEEEDEATRVAKIHTLKNSFKQKNAFNGTAYYVIDCFLYALEWLDSVDREQYTGNDADDLEQIARQIDLMFVDGVLAKEEAIAVFKYAQQSGVSENETAELINKKLRIHNFKPAQEIDQSLKAQKDIICSCDWYAESNSADEDMDFTSDYDPTLDLSNYKLPPISLLKEHDSGSELVSEEELMSNKNLLHKTLASYNIRIDKITAIAGPCITLFEIYPAPDIKISSIKDLEEDLSLSLSELRTRIIVPVPEKRAMGIEVPNRESGIVSFRSVIASAKFQESEYDLPIALGKTVSNETFVFDLTQMPPLLLAGKSGQGKSVVLNTIVASLLYRKHPAQLKFVLIDPNRKELSLFSGIEKHFLAKLEGSEDAICTDPMKVIRTLNALCEEMDKRFELLKEANVRNINEYSAKFINRKLNPNKGHRFLPFIVVIIDEFADDIMLSGKEFEQPLVRLAQLARAVGIHMIIATQQPTPDIINSNIKSYFPAKIAFRLSSIIDSRMVLDQPGAEMLSGPGDALFHTDIETVRLQCAFVDTQEIEAIARHIGEQKAYPSAYELESVDEDDPAPYDYLEERDDKFEEAARLVVQHQQGSTSLIQRKLALGYNRAGRIVDQLEAAGILGPYEGSKARQVLVEDDLSLDLILSDLN